MKIPRWLLAVLGCVSIVLPAAGISWWWVGWPERVAVTFVKTLAAGDRDTVQRLTDFSSARGSYLLNFRSEEIDCTASSLVFEPRTLGEIMRGRVRFKLRGIEVPFVVASGKIIEPTVVVLGGPDSSNHLGIISSSLSNTTEMDVYPLFGPTGWP